MEAALNSFLGRTSLGQTPLKIGRAPDNTLPISDQEASGHHTEIAPGIGGNGYQITDLNSTNGTYVNEQRLIPNIPRTLNSGDVIRIGTTTFTYELSGAGYQPTIPASPSTYEPTVLAPPPVQPAYQQPPVQPAYQQPPVQPAYQQPPVQPAYQQPPVQPAYGSFGASAQPPYTPPPPPPSAYPQPVYPQPAYPQPGGFGQPGYTQPQKKSRAGCWIAVIVILFVLIAGGGGAYYYVTQLLSSPQKTLQTYCNALKSGDYPTAYDQLSKRAQSQISESDFAQTSQVSLATVGGLKECTVTNVHQTSSTTATGTLGITFGNGKTSTSSGPLVYEDGAWKLDLDNS